MKRPLLILFAKAPIAGCVKTRLCPPLTPDQAAGLHSALVQDMIEMLSTFSGYADLELSSDSAIEPWPEITVHRSVQAEGDLGLRIFQALAGALTSGREVAIVVGSDSPGLPASHILKLLESEADVTLGPTLDGGFFAIACRRVQASMFNQVRWSTGFALADVARSAAQCGLNLATGPTWFDVDVEEDLERMLKMSDLPRHAARWSANYRKFRSGSTR